MSYTRSNFTVGSRWTLNQAVAVRRFTDAAMRSVDWASIKNDPNPDNQYTEVTYELPVGEYEVTGKAMQINSNYVGINWLPLKNLETKVTRYVPFKDIRDRVTNLVSVDKIVTVVFNRGKNEFYVNTLQNGNSTVHNFSTVVDIAETFPNLSMADEFIRSTFKGKNCVPYVYNMSTKTGSVVKSAA